MTTKEEQAKAGVPEHRRGQQTGGEPVEQRYLDQNRVEQEETPALRGERPNASEFFADNSSQQVGTDAVTPRSNTPSTPAAIPVGQPLGQSGGEREFNQRQAESSGTKSS